MKHLTLTLSLLIALAIGAVGQTNNFNNVNVNGQLNIKYGTRTTGFVATCVDANGKVEWQAARTDYDSLSVDSLYTGKLRTGTLRIDSFAVFSDTLQVLASAPGGTVSRCSIDCGQLEDMQDSLNNTQWVSNGTGGTVLRDSTNNVGIGTSSPTAKLQVVQPTNGASPIIIGDSATIGYRLTEIVNQQTIFGPLTVPFQSHTFGSFWDGTSVGLSNGLLLIDSIGLSAFRVGSNNISTGINSVTFGIQNVNRCVNGFVQGNRNTMGGGDNNNSLIISSNLSFADSAFSIIIGGLSCGSYADHGTVIGGYLDTAYYYHQVRFGSQGAKYGGVPLPFVNAANWQLNDPLFDLGNGGGDINQFTSCLSIIKNGNTLFGTHSDPLVQLDTNSAIITVLGDTIGSDSLFTVKGFARNPLFYVLETGVYAQSIATADTIITGVATAGSFAAPNGIGGIIFSGTGTAVTYTLTLPANPTEGQKILLTNNGVIITTLSFSAGSNALSVTLTAGVLMDIDGQRWVTFKGGTWY